MSLPKCFKPSRAGDSRRPSKFGMVFPHSKFCRPRGFYWEAQATLSASTFEASRVRSQMAEKSVEDPGLSFHGVCRGKDQLPFARCVNKTSGAEHINPCLRETELACVSVVFPHSVQVLQPRGFLKGKPRQHWPFGRCLPVAERVNLRSK